MTRQEEEGKKKAYEDEEKVYLPADKGKVMVAMDKSIEKGGENSYEYKMQKVLSDMKAKPSKRANKDWDLTEKVSREGRAIIKEMVEKEEITCNWVPDDRQLANALTKSGASSRSLIDVLRTGRLVAV